MATFRLDDSIVAGNRLADGAADDVAGQFDSAGAYNLIGAIDGSAGLEAFGTIYGTAAVPMDPVLGPLRDNGGPTWTHALLPGSPAIDAGNAAGVVSTDQRGWARPADGLGDGFVVPDIGAFELGAAAWHNPTEPLDVNDDGVVSPLDALLVINKLNAEGAGALDAPVGAVDWFVDVNADGRLSPIDALLIINRLNAEAAEGESGERKAESGTGLLLAGTKLRSDRDRDVVRRFNVKRGQAQSCSARNLLARFF